MKLNCQDIKHQLYIKVNVKFKLRSVGRHDMSRGVETKIKKIKGLIVKLSENERISLLQ